MSVYEERMLRARTRIATLDSECARIRIAPLQSERPARDFGRPRWSYDNLRDRRSILSHGSIYDGIFG